MPKLYTSLAAVALWPSSTSGACSGGSLGRCDSDSGRRRASEIQLTGSQQQRRQPQQPCSLSKGRRCNSGFHATACTLTSQMGLLAPTLDTMVSLLGPSSSLDRLKSGQSWSGRAAKHHLGGRGNAPQL